MWRRALTLSQRRYRVTAQVLRAQDPAGLHRTSRTVPALRFDLRPTDGHQADAGFEDCWREGLLAVKGEPTEARWKQRNTARNDPETKLRNIKNQIKATEHRIAACQKWLGKLRSNKREILEKLNEGSGSACNVDYFPSRKIEDNNVGWAAEDFPWSGELRDVLHHVFHIDSFLPMQLEAINATMSGHDVILITTTGGGKSLCYQLPALLSPGLTLVVSPLLSLIEDQIINLKKLGVTAHMLGPDTSRESMIEVYECLEGGRYDIKLLYVTPEKLSKSKKLLSLLDSCYKMGNLSRMAIDEVHCVSQWGNDFRPDYRVLGLLKRQFPDTPIIGVTATSTPTVTEDTKDLLEIPNAVVLKSPLRRENLFYEVRIKPSSHQNVVDDMTETIRNNYDGEPGIIYCLTRRNCTDVSNGLRRRGIEAAAYHAGMPTEDRREVHKRWLSNHIQVICATVAFGMGINKPDVRFVFHHSMSKSVENYFQESGRAGRDGKPAHCLLYFGVADFFRQSAMVSTEKTDTKNLAKMLEYCTSTTRCRHKIISEHFDESESETAESERQCTGLCDVCSGVHETVTRDVSTECRDLLRILQRNKSAKLAITATKLMESARSSGLDGSVHRDLFKHPKHDFQMIVLHMLRKGYLRQEFRFTSYSKHSYLVPDPKSPKLSTSDVTMNLWCSEKSLKRNAYKDWLAKWPNRAYVVSKPPRHEALLQAENGIQLQNSNAVVSQTAPWELHVRNARDLGSADQTTRYRPGIAILTSDWCRTSRVSLPSQLGACSKLSLGRDKYVDVGRFPAFNAVTENRPSSDNFRRDYHHNWSDRSSSWNRRCLAVDSGLGNFTWSGDSRRSDARKDTSYESDARTDTSYESVESLIGRLE